VQIEARCEPAATASRVLRGGALWNARQRFQPKLRAARQQPTAARPAERLLGQTQRLAQRRADRPPQPIAERGPVMTTRVALRRLCLDPQQQPGAPTAQVQTPQAGVERHLGGGGGPAALPAVVGVQRGARERAHGEMPVLLPRDGQRRPERRGPQLQGLVRSGPYARGGAPRQREPQQRRGAPHLPPAPLVHAFTGRHLTLSILCRRHCHSSILRW
jgi:hypothetical protein